MSSVLDTLITDRPNNNTYYNHTDRNRVEAAVVELARLLSAAGYYTKPDSPKTDWAMTDFPTESQMARYLDNVKLCVQQLGAPLGFELPVNMIIDYIGANNIERALLTIKENIEKIQRSYRYCGIFSCGGDCL